MAGGVLIYKDYAVCTLPNIEEVFNNVRPEAVIEALNKFKVEANLIQKNPNITLASPFNQWGLAQEARMEAKY